MENENIIEEVVKIKLTSNERVKIWRALNSERDRLKRHERHLRNYLNPEFVENSRTKAREYIKKKKLLQAGITE